MIKGTLQRTAHRAGHTTLSIQEPDRTETTLLDLDGPRDYRLTAAQWSPDGTQVLVVDSRGRLLLADPQLPGEARLLTEGAVDWYGDELGTASTVVWYVPGNVTFTVTPPESDATS